MRGCGRWLGRLVAIGLLAALGAGLAARAENDAPWRMRVALPPGRDLGATVRELRARGYDIPFADIKRGTFDAVGGAVQFDALTAQGLFVTILEDRTASGGPLAPSALSDYMTPAQVEAKLAQYETQYPNIARRIPYATDHQGRTAWALKISDNVAQDEDEPSVFYVAQHHAREVMTPEVAMDIIDQLLAGYGIDPAITHWVDSTEIFVAPTHNPDGADYVFTADSWWRKNRRDNGDGSFGVDPNRNYPFQWGGTVCSGSSGATGDDTYRGPAAGSEPTTQGFMALARAYRPVYTVSYHTYGPLAIHPYGCSNEYADQPDAQAFRELGSAVSTTMVADDGYWFHFGTAAELLYDVDGEMLDWFYGELGSFPFTFELNDSTQGFQPDYATWRNTTVARARPGWRFFLEQLDRARLTGHVRDACSGAPLLAQVALGGQVFSHGEPPRQTIAANGRYDWPVLPGARTLNVSAAGYHAQSWTTAVGFTPAARDVRLVPAGSRGAEVTAVAVADAGGDNDGQADPGETVDLTLSAVATGEAVTGLTAMVSSSDPYVQVIDGSASFGSVAAGATAAAGDAVRIAFAANTPDQHVATLDVAFTAHDALCSAAPVASTLRVTRGVPACPSIAEPLDQDPHWLIDNGASAGGWAFGAPGGGIGPSAPYTGANVYGTNLTGNYADNADYFLTAGPYDLSTLRHTELRFARFLRSEPGYDIARVALRIGASGAWTTVWEGFGRDTAWVPVRYDVSALADFEAEVYVRFELKSDTGTTDAGFYLDDLVFCGEAAASASGKVKYKGHVVDDSNPAYGNNNGRLDIEETATLKIDVLNTSLDTAHLVSGVLTTATPGVEIRNAVAEWPDVASAGSATSLAPHFTVTAHSGCGTSAVFTLTMRWSDGFRADSTFSVPIGQLSETARLTDDFETDKGWVVGGNATAGIFVRQDPHGVTSGTDGLVQPEDDHTAAPGVTCWVTGNPVVGPNFDPLSGDVDRGLTSITSPTFDGTGGGNLLVRFARFFHRTSVQQLNDGIYRARLSNNNGATWTNIETLSANASAWAAQEFDVTALITPTATMRLRFEAEEVRRQAGDPLIELLVDDVSVVRRDIQCTPFAGAETKRPNAVGGTLHARRTFDDVVLEWSAPASDATHDPARFYPVYRAFTPSGGFTKFGEPSAAAWHDVDAAAPGAGTRYYLVAARNAAGTSGEEPAP